MCVERGGCGREEDECEDCDAEVCVLKIIVRRGRGAYYANIFVWRKVMYSVGRGRHWKLMCVCRRGADAVGREEEDESDAKVCVCVCVCVC